METSRQECRSCETENLTVCVEPTDIVHNCGEPKDEEPSADGYHFVVVKDESEESLNSDGNETSRCAAELYQENGSKPTRCTVRRQGINQLQSGMTVEERRETFLQRVREHQRLRIMRETEEQRQLRLQRVREYQRKRIQGETKEQREARIQRVRENQRRKRLIETEEERAKRLQKVRENQRKRISEETPEQREIRLQKVREAQRLRRLSETEEQRIARIRRIVEYQRRRAKQETPEERQTKREQKLGSMLIHNVENCKEEDSLKFGIEERQEARDEYHNKRSSEKRFLCSSCARGFSTKQCVEAHELWCNRKNKPFACSHCMKSFASKQGLNYHIIRHGAEQNLLPSYFCHNSSYFSQSVVNNSV